MTAPKTRRRDPLRRSLTVTALASTVATTLSACVIRRDVVNASFDLSLDDAVADIARMRADTRPLHRPVVVLAGYRSWATLVHQLVWRLYPITSGDKQDFLPIAYANETDIEDIAAIVVDRVERRWPSDNPNETIEVDVIGVSMGGLVGRTAALPLGRLPDGSETRSKRLKIRALYTLGSPHTGAVLADTIAPDQAARDMKPGSAFLARLNAEFEHRDYDLVPYAVLNDTWVGATNTAPPGEEPIWTGGSYLMSHFMITRDARIIADLARRLRDEAPIGRPSAPPRD
ncbi:MAG: esterase/lipase family protein [Phycisphaerales bacterium]